MRLDKFICESLDVSRTTAKEYIKKNYISVNHKIITQSNFQVSPDKDMVMYQNEELFIEEYYYYIFNKPSGYVCSKKDHSNATVFELLPKHRKNDLHCVGRLDKDTQGLLIVTNDGLFSHSLLSPASHVPKKYYVEVDGILSDEHVLKFREGFDYGEKKPSLPAELTVTSVEKQCSCGTVIIQEGKYHQIKRMMEVCGCKVTFLKRLAMGKYLLDSNLAIGNYRKFTKEEMEYVKEYKSRFV